jgi:hypothetical protein
MKPKETAEGIENSSDHHFSEIKIRKNTLQVVIARINGAKPQCISPGSPKSRHPRI